MKRFAAFVHYLPKQVLCSCSPLNPEGVTALGLNVGASRTPDPERDAPLPPVVSTQAKSCGGNVAPQAQIATVPANPRRSAHPEMRSVYRNSCNNGGNIAVDEWVQEVSSPMVVAHAVEFVALPGKATKLRALIPPAMRDAAADSDTFAGCIVLLSEQEARLVTVITLWKAADPTNEYLESCKKLENILEPYVDRWLRSRRLAAFVCPP